MGLCLNRTAVYSLYAAALLRTPAVLWLTQVLPALSLLWLLWLHTSGRAKRFGWALPLAASVGCAACAAVELAGELRTGWANLMSTRLLPLMMLLLLLWGGWEACSLRGWYRRFFALGGCLLVLTAIGGAFSLWQGGGLGDVLTTA